MDVLQDKEGHSNVRLIILVLVVLVGIVAALLYFPPVPTRTEEKRTSGDITFLDGTGNPLGGVLQISVDGELQPAQQNANFISWTKVPNAVIYFNAMDTKGISVDFRISGDSKGRVLLENYGINIPEGVNISAPGNIIKYVEVSSTGISFSEAKISLQYTDAQLNGLNESSLVIYRYDSAMQMWSELPTKIDAANKLASATVNSLSFFALSTRIPEEIEVHDTKKVPIISDIKTYDEGKKLKKEARNSVLPTSDVPDKGELVVDALAAKNVAVRLKVNVASGGEVILDDFGKKNPVSAPLPGRAVKFVEIGANNIQFSSASITIRYTDAELNGGSENDLTIYHWNGASWDAVPTIIDTVNKTLSTTTASLSVWGVGTPYQYILSCDSGTTLSTTGGSYSTNYTCGSTTLVPQGIGQLPEETPIGTSTYIRFGAASTGTQDFAHFINNTVFTSDVNVTGINGSISMRAGTSGNTVGGMYEIGYYDPTGAANNFVGLFNSTTATTTSNIQNSYPLSFNSQSGIIPAGTKLAVRVWMNSSVSDRKRFYSGSTTSTNDSSINITIALPVPSAPNITSWGNSKTNNQTSNFSINPNELVQFNATANQTIDTWNWYKDNAIQSSNTTNTFNTSWSTAGSYHIDVNATNSNGTSRTVTWNVTVRALPLPNITSWGNNKTNNRATSITLNTSEGVRLNATANQSITTWNWYVNDTNQNNNQSTFNTSWGTRGSYHVDVNATNPNGTSNTINWTVRVVTNVTVQGNITDKNSNPLVTDQGNQDEDGNPIQSGTGSTYNYTVPIGGSVTFNASATKNISATFTIQGASANSKVIFDDYGTSNPASSSLPGAAVKFVNISAYNLNFSEVNVKIYYTNAELGGINENALVIYHWNGASWDALPTTVDAANNTLTATTTSLSPFGVATRFIYYLENNATIQSVGFDGNTSYNASGTTVPLTLIPYENLLKNGTMGASNNISFTTTSTTTQYWLFSFYLPFNYSVNTQIAANTTFNLSWDAVSTNNVVNVSLIDYNPANGADVVIGNRSFTATSTARTNYSFQINHSAYVVPEDHRLLFRINTTTPTAGTVYLYFNDYASNITVVETALGYNLSGMVTDKDSGSALSGATVMTNTSLSTTTNSTGYYNFTGISNGSYLVNASFTGYVTNSTTAIINGANVTNANITLSLAYLLSGYVTNATTGAAINGATVTTNTSQTTSTNATGYYSFNLSNGTYIITASKTGYSDNSTTKTINGANATNVNITLAGVSSVSGKILVATNRFVILDDPNDAGAAVVTGSGFQIPTPNDWGSRSTVWTGIATIVNATAMYVDNNGFPVSGKTINFTLYYPNGTALTTVRATTNSLGIANFSYNLDNKNFYGRWNIRAENSSIGANTSFIYNWWGCSWGSSGTCGNQHSSATPPAGGNANSPYLSGRNYDTGITQHSSHGADWTNSDTNACTNCHQSFDNNTGDAYTARYDNHPADVHRNVTCDNANCHGNYSQHNTNQLVYSCYNSGCHGNGSAWDRKDISNKSTLNSATVSTAVSIYSYNNASSFNATFHTPNSTVPCIICHGPMHNISKPDLSTRFTRNNITEDSQCKTCHSSYTEHNSSNVTSGGVNCTLCHSDDVHYIQVFAQNATYINLTRSNPNPARGNCTNCHQNATFFAALKAQPKAGNYTGRNPPQVAVPLEHSNDPTAGAKWNTYWTNSQQLTWCMYCHSNTTHSAAALGRPASWDGNNIVNSSLTQNTTWCASCHWQGYANGTNTYSDMVNAFTGAGLLVPPEISGNATYGANTSIYEYTNHSLYTGFSPNLNDSTCDRCHGYNYPFTTITQLMHNQTRVGGANCVDCHDIGGIPLLAHVNVTAANDTNAIHRNLNTNATHVLNTSVYYNNNLRCWACHGNGSEPTVPNAHPTTYKTPENCTDCHIQSATQNFNFTPTNTLLNVTEHYWNATDIRVPVSACYACHNKSEMLIFANDPDNGSGAVYGGLNGGNNSTSHYGRKRADLRNGINATCSYCHQNASTVFYTAMIDPTYNRSIQNHSWRYNSSNPACTSSQCHSTGWLHNSTLARPNFTLPNSTFCLGCHGRNNTSGLINFTGAVTSIKEMHNNTINCTECHLGSSRDIHPAKYLQTNASYNTSNSTAVDCTSCHQNLTVYPSLSRTPPKIPSPMYHSDNISNGTLWNTTGYWTNVTVTSCTYCHNDTKHNITALGRPAYWKGNNIVNSSITSASTWCAGCHYRGYSSGNKSYNDMTSTFTVANLPVPPEITNGTYAPYNFSRYYNHSLINYTDVACRLCHGINLTSNALATAFVHGITWGTCTDCHYSFAAMNMTTRPDRFVNSTMFNASPHGLVACSNCHTKGHKNIGARKACEDCHAVQSVPITNRDRHNITGDPYNYKVGGVSVVNITDCTTCHDAQLYNNATSTYGYNKSKDCDYCHTYPDKTYS